MTRRLVFATVVALAGAWPAASAPAEDGEPSWSTMIGSLTIGARGETATFRDVRSTCNALRLTLPFGSAASGIRRCLPEPEARRVLLQVEDGRVASANADPDDDRGRCVTKALTAAHLDGLTCTLEASVSR